MLLLFKLLLSYCFNSLWYLCESSSKMLRPTEYWLDESFYSDAAMMIFFSSIFCTESILAFSIASSLVDVATEEVSLISWLLLFYWRCKPLTFSSSFKSLFLFLLLLFALELLVPALTPPSIENPWILEFYLLRGDCVIYWLQLWKVLVVLWGEITEWSPIEKYQ